MTLNGVLLGLDAVAPWRQKARMKKKKKSSAKQSPDLTGGEAIHVDRLPRARMPPFHTRMALPIPHFPGLSIVRPAWRLLMTSLHFFLAAQYSRCHALSLY